jgi:flavin reductase (DIM6/NTAB) family NADH-FMN oxidoreductase RutF|tara:strand:- start:11598 stop:12152 length:555 start_codon:yes stop_codon:yes gene_type:complete
MIERQIKRCLGQMSKGVQVVGSEHNGIHRLYTSHWVSQVAFEEPIVMASVSPKHDTYSLILASGRFTVSILAGDQIAEGQYFSYPGHKFKYALTEFVEIREDLPYVPNSIAWLTCEVFKQTSMRDHELFFAEVTDVREGRLKEDPLVYSSLQGWRIASTRARQKNVSVRDQLLEKLANKTEDVG